MFRSANGAFNMSGNKVRYCQAQHAFIRATRDSIKTCGSRFFNDKDWRDVKLISGSRSSLTSSVKLTTDSFYVRSLAAWVPHLLFPSFLPKCPKCCDNHYINLGESRWIDNPVILYGIATHRYLDTMMYHCDTCNSKFAGYNKKSMQLNSKNYVGYFNFYLGEKGYAVDEELYSFIVTNEAGTQATATIHERIHSMTVDNYVNNYYKYLHAVGSHKVRYCKRGGVATHDTQQRTLDYAFAAPGDSNVVVRSSISDLKDEIRNLRYKLDHATSLAQGDINLRDIIEMKRNNNCINPPLKGIGESKLKQLISHGCVTMKQLLEFLPEDFPVINAHTKLGRWKSIARADLQQKEKEVERLKAAIEAKEENLILEQVVRDGEDDPLGDNPPTEDAAPQPSTEDENALPPLLSEMNDPAGYNARVISKYRIDSIVTSEFQLRKEVMESKMMSLSAVILKIDFNYKIASKIRAWKGQGDSLDPLNALQQFRMKMPLRCTGKVSNIPSP